MKKIEDAFDPSGVPPESIQLYLETFALEVDGYVEERDPDEIRIVEYLLETYLVGFLEGFKSEAILKRWVHLMWAEKTYREIKIGRVVSAAVQFGSEILFQATETMH